MTVTVQALLVSRDIPMTQVLSRLMDQSAIHAEICSEPRQAMGKLCRAKFEAIVVDFDQPKEALGLIATVQESPAHRKTVLVAISSSQTAARKAFQAGAYFVLERPVIPRVASATLKACYSFMLREKSRSFRCPLQVPIHGIGPRGFVAASINLSEGGLAMQTTTPVKMGEHLDLRLTLPGLSQPCELKTEVCWDDGRGRVGVLFLDVPAPTLELLQSFLWERMHKAPAKPLPAKQAEHPATY